MALRPEVSARFRALLRERYGTNPEEVATGRLVRQHPFADADGARCGR